MDMDAGNKSKGQKEAAAGAPGQPRDSLAQDMRWRQRGPAK